MTDAVLTPAAPDFEARRFQSAAQHYLAGRPPYPGALIARTVELIGIGAEDRVLDLGCGPAQLALAFAPFVREAVGIDPEPVMMAEGREAARAAGNVTLMEGRAEEIDERLGAFKAAVIGRAFHWMDREAVLARLDRLLAADGAVVLFGEEHPRIEENARVRAFHELIEDWSKADTTRAALLTPQYRRHTSVLLASPFGRIEEVRVIWRRALTLDLLIERALSYSATSRARLGAHADALIGVLTDKMSEWEAEGPMEEVLASSAMIAWRGQS